MPRFGSRRLRRSFCGALLVLDGEPGHLRRRLNSSPALLRCNSAEQCGLSIDAILFAGVRRVNAQFGDRLSAQMRDALADRPPHRPLHPFRNPLHRQSF